MNNTAAAHCQNCSALFGAPVCGDCCRERTTLLKTIAKITAENEKLRSLVDELRDIVETCAPGHTVAIENARLVLGGEA